MIGQKKNQDLILMYRLNRNLPRFIIIAGEKGSGRLTLAKLITKSVSAYTVIVGTSVDEVREVIESSYKVDTTTFYIFRDADKMKAEAKNALLKITEEPPKNSYFIMTVSNTDQILATLKSRATVLRLDPYSIEELVEYAKLLEIDDVDLIRNRYFNTPHELELFKQYGNRVLDFCSVLDKQLRTHQPVIGLFASNLKYKETGEGYDPSFVLKIMMRKWILENPPRNLDKLIQFTVRAQQELSVVSARRQPIVDGWARQVGETFLCK